MVLLLGLLLLAGLSLLALAAASDSGLHLQASRNASSEQQALAAAQSANKWAEYWLLSQDGSSRIVPCAIGCSSNQPVRSAGNYPPLPEYQPESWWLEHGHADGFDPVSGQRLALRSAGRQPLGRWIIEELHFQAAAGPQQPALSYYRITARAVQADSGTPVVVESILARPWGNASWRDALPRRFDQPMFCLALMDDTDCGRRVWQRRL
jgi:Tfp pilus assembly protein PilX